MRLRRLSLFSLALSALCFFSCIDSEQTDEAILEVDKKAIEKYLEDNPIVGVQETYDEITGIRVIWQEVSDSGLEVSLGDTVSVDYTGKLLTNRVFDTSIESVARANNIYTQTRNYIPLRFPIGNRLLIPGFEAAVAQMEAGDKATVLMPSLFGYGNNPPDGIPTNAPLIFELELISIKDGPDQ
ncbi:FKBP-type peptidyl-prolyl cis-trans isomerase [Algoriphagus namhaensis]